MLSLLPSRRTETTKPPANFHFSRQFKGDTRAISLTRHEHYLFSCLDLRPKMRILEVGCGAGSAALELAEFADVFVVGVELNARKVEKAQQTANRLGLSDRVTFIRGDYSDLHSLFKENTFDGIYCVESLKCSASFGSIYQDLFYLLRPEGKLAIYEWCWTQEMNLNNTNHRVLAELLENSTGISNRPISDRSIEAALEALQASRFQVVHYEDLSQCSSCAMTPWYTLLDNAFTDARTRWSSDDGELQQHDDFGGLTKRAAMILSQAGHLGLFTPMALFVAKKGTFDTT